MILCQEEAIRELADRRQNTEYRSQKSEYRRQKLEYEGRRQNIAGWVHKLEHSRQNADII